MADKQRMGLYAPDGSKYGTPTTGDGELVTMTVSDSGDPKHRFGAQAPDGSIYFTLTDGAGALA